MAITECTETLWLMSVSLTARPIIHTTLDWGQTGHRLAEQAAKGQEFRMCADSMTTGQQTCREVIYMDQVLRSKGQTGTHPIKQSTPQSSLWLDLTRCHKCCSSTLWGGITALSWHRLLYFSRQQTQERTFKRHFNLYGFFKLQSKWQKIWFNVLFSRAV